MTTEEFVKGFYIEKLILLKTYLSGNSQSEVGQLIKSLTVNSAQYEILSKILDSSFRDIFYSILLGLDGCSSIGNLIQQQFTIYDENNNQVCGEERLGEVERKCLCEFY